MELKAPTQGGHANKTGSILEGLVRNTLSAHGFAVVPWALYSKSPGEHGEELLLSNVQCETLYGGKGYTEFLLRSRRFGLDLRIECKWQQTTGSVDEKLPFTYLNCVEMPEDEVIILIDGKGFREGAIRWLRKAAGERRYIPAERPNKQVRVMDVTEFLTWANSTFR